jgi:hypothetical protein
VNIDELPEELKQQVEAKFNAVLKAFLQSCTKDRRKKVTQFREPDFNELITSTSSAPAAPEVRIFELSTLILLILILRMPIMLL